MLFSLMIYK